MVNEVGGTEGRGCKIGDILGNGTNDGNSIVIIVDTDPTGNNFLLARTQIAQELPYICAGPTLRFYKVSTHLGLCTLILLHILLHDRSPLLGDGRTLLDSNHS